MGKTKDRFNELIEELVASKVEDELHRRAQRAMKRVKRSRAKTASLYGEIKGSVPLLPPGEDDVIDVDASEAEGNGEPGRPYFRRVNAEDYTVDKAGDEESHEE